MEIIDQKYVNYFFAKLNEAKVEYLLIKNICNELPRCLKNGKDIDIIVNKIDMGRIEQIMLDAGFLPCAPPLGKDNGWAFLYGLQEYQFWKLNNCPYDLYVDISFSLSCKSLMPSTWVPLDNYIQKYIWSHKLWDKNNSWWIMDINSRFVYYLVRCIFDKKVFSELYIREIEFSKNLIDENEVKTLLQTVFFKYSDRLLQLVEEKRYNEIIEDYIKFMDY